VSIEAPVFMVVVPFIVEVLIAVSPARRHPLTPCPMVKFKIEIFWFMVTVSPSCTTKLSKLLVRFEATAFMPVPFAAVFQFVSTPKPFVPCE